MAAELHLLAVNPARCVVRLQALAAYDGTDKRRRRRRWTRRRLYRMWRGYIRSWNEAPPTAAEHDKWPGGRRARPSDGRELWTAALELRRMRALHLK